MYLPASSELILPFAAQHGKVGLDDERTEEHMLFDRAIDPGERHNLVEELPELAASMKSSGNGMRRAINAKTAWTMWRAAGDARLLARPQASSEIPLPGCSVLGLRRTTRPSGVRL